jgi:hypothetical protein
MATTKCNCERCGHEMEEWRDELCGDCVEYCDCCGTQLEMDQIGLCDDCIDDGEDEDAPEDELEVRNAVTIRT